MRQLLVMLAAMTASVASAYDWSGKTGVVTLTETAEVLDGDVAVVAALDGIVLQGKTTDLIFNNASTALTLKGTITGDGRIIKRGAANVFFGKPHTTSSTSSKWGKNIYQDYYTAGGIVVEKGDLYFPQDGKIGCCYGPTTVNGGTTLHIQPDSQTCLLALNGSGLVSNGKTWTCWDNPDHQVSFFIGYYGARDISDFSGTFEGNFAAVLAGNVRIHGSDTCRAAMSVSVFRNAFDSREIGVTRLTKFGNRPPVSYRGYGPDDKDLSAFASPMGIGSSYYYGVDYDMNYGGHLIYTGTGETTDKLFRFGGVYNPQYDVLDAGATGGVNFAGEFSPYGNNRYYGAILSGSNTVEMTVSGKVTGGDGVIHFIKAGSGTWNWSPSTRTKLAGAFFVVDGTFKFPTIADIGEDCSLGLSTNCWKSIKYAALPDYWNNVANRLSCEIVLGDWEKGGTKFPTLAYSGTTDSASNRRIGLIGIGGTIANTDATGALKLTGGVSPRTLAEVRDLQDETVTPKTLRLDAVGSANTIGPITENGAGMIDIVKTGVGKWAVKENFAIRGGIDVQEGTLSFEPKGFASYTWFRYTVTQLNSANDAGLSQYLWQRQLGLFDKNGNRIANGGFTFVGPAESVRKGWHVYEGNYDWTALEPGQVTLGEYHMKQGKTSGLMVDNPPDNLFLDSTTYLRATLPYNCQLNNKMFHFPLVFRLPEGAEPVKYVDIVQHIGCAGGNHIGAFTLEGSANGSDWTMLLDKRCEHRTAEQWNSTGVTVVNGQNQNCRTAGSEFGYEIATGLEERDAHDLSTASEIKVAHGATLQAAPAGAVELPKLTVDCAGEGEAVVTGFKIAEKGVLTIWNEPASGSYEIPADFTGCTDLTNLTKWQLVIDGNPRQRTLSVKNGRLHVSRQGITVIYW